MIDEDDAPSIQARGLRRALAQVRREEEFHEKAFGLMGTWMNAAGDFDPGLDENQCVLRVSDLLPRAGFAAGSNVVFTDGGLGTLFQRHGIVLEVVDA